jgi:flagellar hook-basal body complex protein FliE
MVDLVTAIASAPRIGAPIVPPRMPGESDAASFGSALGKALADVNALQQQGQEAALAIASGKSVDMAAALVAIEKANVSFQFAMQVRNKLLDAYGEIMRMSV